MTAETERPAKREAVGLETGQAERVTAGATATPAAVAIVNYRTPELVEQCLESVAATADGLELETVVIDNASGDGSVERLRASVPQARVIAMSENGGFAAGVNAAFEHTSAELVIVLNPDTEVLPGALQAMLGRLRSHPRTGIVGPLLEDEDGAFAPSAYRRFPNLITMSIEMCVPVSYALAYAPRLHPYALPLAAHERGGAVAHVCGAAMAIRREAYDQAGPLDEGFFMYLEETEWQQRVADKGWTIELEPAARVRHLVRGGGEAALVPPAYGVKSAIRYTHMQGVPKLVSRATLAFAFVASWFTLRLIACLPTRRERASGQARAYAALLRELQ